MIVGDALQGIIISILVLFLLVIAGRIAHYRLWYRNLYPKRVTRKVERPLNGDTLVIIGVEVAARLRAGTPAKQSWLQTWERFSHDSVTDFDDAGIPDSLLALTNQKHSELDRSAAGAIVSACRFSYYCGAPLADVLEQISSGISDNLLARRAQERAFAGPKMSSRILTALPILAVFGGQALGAHSINWLLGSGLGRICFVIGVLLLAAGHGVSVRLIEVDKAKAKNQLLSTTLCDLARSGLKSGVPIPTVLSILASTSGVESLKVASRALLLGASWEDAWDKSDTRTGLLANALQPCWEQGISPVNLLKVSVEQARARQLAAVEEDAAKLEVKLVLPLGLLLLPAFVALGVIPILFTLFNGQLGIS